MPHPIYGPPEHKLHRVAVKLWVPTSTNGRHTKVTASGWAETKNKALWTYTEMWDHFQGEHGLAPADAARHLLLAAIQDRPVTQDGLQMALRGGVGQDPLPW